jgi:putative PIN family toxin of toxin-antitoxin system
VRVLLDANVFVSAIHRGPSHRIAQRWLRTGSFEIVMCPELLAEVSEVLTQRPRLRRWIDLEAAGTFIETIRAVVELVGDPLEVEAATRDRDDDYLVALAREHDADLIVTGDRDLLDWAGQESPVITPAAFEEMLNIEPATRRSSTGLPSEVSDARRGARHRRGRHGSRSGHVGEGVAARAAGLRAPRSAGRVWRGGLLPGRRAEGGRSPVRIARNHPLPDGNKRLAWQSLTIFLALNGYEFATTANDAVAFMLGIAAGEVDEEAAEAWIRERIEPGGLPGAADETP